VADSAGGPVPGGPAGGLAARVRRAAQRPVLFGLSYAGDLALAAAVTIAAVVTAARGLLYVPRPAHTIVLPNLPYTFPPPQHAHLEHLLAVPSWALAGVVATTLPLALRRTYPTTAFGVILVAFIATRTYSTAITVAAALFGAYCAVVYSKYRRMALLCLLAAAVIFTVAYPEATTQVPERFTALLVLLPTAALGNMMRMWRQRAGESADRLRLAQASHEVQTRRAVELERARIASELHDVVTHNVSVMVVQAGAARRVVDSSPGDVRAALAAIEEGGRSAMTELRHLLGLLAPAAPSGEPGTAGQPAELSADDALRPQPGLADVPALVARVRAAGLPVGYATTGQPRDVPQGIDLAAFRVVQEALTNVIKHANRAPTAVRVEYRARDLAIDIANEAPAGPGAGPGGGNGGGNGRGLIGLRERISIYGGSLAAGARPGGGWRVRATVPLDQASAGDDAPAPAGVRGIPA